ncbi:MAG: hypothetical protein HYV07_12585 [Deltaproteobacteria bacterium]|nr:hypothetical protein [Deltaproteobacteria bacterium]
MSILRFVASRPARELALILGVAGCEAGSSSLGRDGAQVEGGKLDADAREDAEVPDGGFEGMDALSDAGADAGADAELPDAGTSTSVTSIPLRAGGIRIRGAGVALAVEAPDPTDEDTDGLSDSFEDRLLEGLRPVLLLAPDEPALGDGSVISLVGRVFAASTEPLVLRAMVMIGWTEDYGSCGLTAHHGDSERFAAELIAAPGESGAFDVVRFYTAAHENTVSDRGRVFDAPSLAEVTVGEDPETGSARFLLFPSERKHATYASHAICVDAFNLPCLRETCATESDGVRLVPPVINAGEDEARLVDALDAIGFLGETAWGEADFCGGLGGNGCAAPARNKLVVDPFAAR